MLDPKIYQPEKNDVFLVSFPKSGNTWVATFLVSYFFDELVAFGDVSKWIPSVHRDHQLIAKIQSNPRIIKSHLSQTASYRRVIYVVRDVRDVVVSFFHHHRLLRKIDEGMTLDRYVLEFVDRKDGFGDWADHANSWLDATPSQDMLLFRYEDLLHDARSEFTRMLHWLGGIPDEVRLNSALRHSSFQSMRESEAQARAFEGGFFVRAGLSGGWRDALSCANQNLLTERYASTLRRLGYPVS